MLSDYYFISSFEGEISIENTLMVNISFYKYDAKDVSKIYENCITCRSLGIKVIPSK